MLKNFEAPFFLLGNPRSGTSLLRLMLNSHPNIIVPPESGFLQWWFQKYKGWKYQDSLSGEKVNSYVEDILSSKKIEDWGLNASIITSMILKYKPSNYGELSSLVYLSYKQNSMLEGFKIGDKNNYYIHHLRLLDSIYPVNKYIHLIRDGRDVACSYKKIDSLITNSKYKPILPSNIINIANEWNTNVSLVNSFIMQKEGITIRYEDLLLNPVKTLHIICDFIEIPFHEQMLDFYKVKLNDEPKSTLDWKEKTLEPLDSSNVNNYLNIMSKDELVEFNNLAQKNLKAFGYVL